MNEYVTRAREFVRQVIAEFRKVTWPNRQEVMNSTAVVIVLTGVLAFFLGGVDIGLARVVERIWRGVVKQQRQLRLRPRPRG